MNLLQCCCSTSTCIPRVLSAALWKFGHPPLYTKNNKTSIRRFDTKSVTYSDAGGSYNLTVFFRSMLSGYVTISETSVSDTRRNTIINGINSDFNAIKNGSAGLTFLGDDVVRATSDNGFRQWTVELAVFPSTHEYSHSSFIVNLNNMVIDVTNGVKAIDSVADNMFRLLSYRDATTAGQLMGIVGAVVPNAASLAPHVSSAPDIITARDLTPQEIINTYQIPWWQHYPDGYSNGESPPPFGTPFSVYRCDINDTFNTIIAEASFNFSDMRAATKHVLRINTNRNICTTWPRNKFNLTFGGFTRVDPICQIDSPVDGYVDVMSPDPEIISVHQAVINADRVATLLSPTTSVATDSVYVEGTRGYPTDCPCTNAP